MKMVLGERTASSVYQSPAILVASTLALPDPQMDETLAGLRQRVSEDIVRMVPDFVMAAQAFGLTVLEMVHILDKMLAHATFDALFMLTRFLGNSVTIMLQPCNKAGIASVGLVDSTRVRG